MKISQVKELKLKETGRYFEVEFTDKRDKTEYDYEFTKEGRIKEISIEYSHKSNPSSKKIGKAAG